MTQLFSPVANTLARLVLVSLLVAPPLSVAVSYAMMRSNHVTGASLTLEQPVPFSHRHHAGELGLDCRYCHGAVERAAFAGMPATTTCMTCHSRLFTNAAMLEPIRQSLVTATPVQWNRVHRLPDHVYFDHAVHVHNGIGCSTCHGDVQQMPLIRQVAPLTMSWCLDCHRDPRPYLRPSEAVFDMTWTAPEDQPRRGDELLARYAIDPESLVDCSRCHR
ncbi:MAG: cytochrome c3 family protein [Gammaproteobacteria bacterium]|nr:cytochrome c3 family protein [Gammaproteobacteria bacterium]